MEKSRPKYSKIKSPKKTQIKKEFRNSEQNKIRSSLLILTNNEIVPYKKYCSVLNNSRDIKDISKEYQITLKMENPLYFGNLISNTKQEQPNMFDNKSKSNKLKSFNLYREINSDTGSLFVLEGSKAKENTANLYPRNNNLNLKFHNKINTVSHSISPVKKKSERNYKIL